MTQERAPLPREKQQVGRKGKSFLSREYNDSSSGLLLPVRQAARGSTWRFFFLNAYNRSWTFALFFPYLLLWKGGARMYPLSRCLRARLYIRRDVCKGRARARAECRNKKCPCARGGRVVGRGESLSRTLPPKSAVPLSFKPSLIT